MTENNQQKSVLTQKPKKGLKKSMNPNKRKMTVAVAETFEDIQIMNKKALNLLAKRA
ncbi:hypothetical protein [Bacillus sp. B1-b2]|uniref:hypothetical protein n=1 Tax=Bacillus sp. B1-b2 TaxID=2653201 RepID=UPI001D020D2D|nr:hypothetical protein [Bacillus sp. B1-b2]